MATGIAGCQHAEYDAEGHACPNILAIQSAGQIEVANNEQAEDTNIHEERCVAVGQADAVRILLPMNKCENLVAGVNNGSTGVLIEDVLKKLSDIISGQN